VDVAATESGIAGEKNMATKTTTAEDRALQERITNLDCKNPTMYKLRAEFLYDIFGFLKEVTDAKQGAVNVAILPLQFHGGEGLNRSKTTDPDGQPVWVHSGALGYSLTFGTYASTERLKHILENGEDWHVMFDTLAEEDKYTGER
jgi:hypothetical protein